MVSLHFSAREKTILLDHWEALKKKTKKKWKNELLFLIYILSHKAIISMAWPASYEIIISSVFFSVLHEQILMKLEMLKNILAL